jgi:microcystin-dependent protein
VGELDGVEAVTLIVSEMPAHSHLANASTNPADQPSPGGNIWASEPVGATNPYNHTTAPNTPMANLMGNAGGNQPHNNLMPYLTVTFIIALQGVFPARN